ncbi:MAG: hypothetical protein EOM78_19010, partial [Erysipelotrichia bacterium]|nr:hypothetical protein [Erysipelotrichia bacterium]
RTRFENFLKAIEDDLAGRKNNCKEEIDFFIKRKGYSLRIVEAIERTIIPLRVTHNDTKLNNVLINLTEMKASTVIDLDTVMPGSIVYDFGGFKDTRINNIIQQANKVIIPTLTSIVDVQATMATLKDVAQINKNIVIAINRTKNNNKAIELKEYLSEEIKKSFQDLDISIIFVRESSVLEDSLFDCEYVETKAGNNRFKRHIYRNAIEDMIILKKDLEK